MATSGRTYTTVGKPPQKNTELFNNLKFLKRKAKELKDLRFIMNECLCNGAYSDGNINEQVDKLEAKGVPQWEIDLVSKASKFRKDKAHMLFKNLETYMKKMEDKNEQKNSI